MPVIADSYSTSSSIAAFLVLLSDTASHVFLNKSCDRGTREDWLWFRVGKQKPGNHGEVFRIRHIDHA